MSSKKKDYVHEHERRFHPFVGYCWGCHKSIRTYDTTCPNCGVTLKETPRRFPQKMEKLSTKVFEDEKESTHPTSMPNFELVFGGFKQKK